MLNMQDGSPKSALQEVIDALKSKAELQKVAVVVKYL